MLIQCKTIHHLTFRLSFIGEQDFKSLYRCVNDHLSDKSFQKLLVSVHIQADAFQVRYILKPNLEH
jgi:hypothetical protein